MNTPLRTNARWMVAGAVLLALSPFCGPSKAHAQAMADYTSTPPFIADAVPPNVLLLMDNSGAWITRRIMKVVKPMFQQR